MTPLKLDEVLQQNRTRALGCDSELRKRSRSMLSRLPFHQPLERQLLFADWTGGRFTVILAANSFSAPSRSTKLAGGSTCLSCGATTLAS